jgi:hypothetical protein
VGSTRRVKRSKRSWSAFFRVANPAPGCALPGWVATDGVLFKGK